MADPLSSGLVATDQHATSASPRDVARAFLIAGEAGVRQWNDLRAQKADTLDLSLVDLSGLRLDGVNFAGCTLRNAFFSGSKLPGACFDGCDLRGANFDNARAEFTSFRKVKLANARLTGANLRWCRFDGSDLRNADFTDAVVEPCDFSMTDMAGTRLSSDLLSGFKESVARIEAAGHHPRAVFFSIAGFSAFAVITGAGVSDIALISDQGSVKIPVLATDVSVRAFFFVAPLLCMAFLTYLALYLRHLSRLLLKLPLRLPDGTEITEPLSPWMQNIAPELPQHLPTSADQTEDNRSILATGSRRMVVFVTRWLVPVTLTVMLCEFLGSRRERDLWALYGLTLLSVLATRALWRRPRIDISSRVRFVPVTPFRASWLYMLVLAVGGALAILAVTHRQALPLHGRGAKLDGTHFEDLHLVGADFSRASLNGATFDGVDLRGAIFYAASLQGIGGKCGHFPLARFDRADLRSAWLGCADFDRALLSESIAEGASLRYARLKEAILVGANLTKADLRGADLRGATLTGARLDEAHLEGSWCNEDTRWPDGFDPHLAGLDCTAPDPSARERLGCDPKRTGSFCATRPEE